MFRSDPRWPEAALCEAAGKLGLSMDGRRLLRIGHCAIVALPAHGLVARIATPGTPSERLESEMRFARFIHQAGLPVLPPADDITDRPIETMTGPVTFWPFVKSIDRDIDWRWLGDTLRRIHELRPRGEIDSVCNPLRVVAARIERYAASANARTERVRVLWAAHWRAKRILESRSLAGNVGLVHGDPTNVIVTVNGPVLIDFDLSGMGPVLWDLVSIAVRHKRFAVPLAVIEDCYESYGVDPRTHVLFEDLLSVRELLDCSFALMVNGAGEIRAHDELEIRLRALEDPSDRSEWTPISRAWA
jgi:hypothetical protein